MRARQTPREVKHDGVEQDETRLLEQAAAELRRRLDRHRQDPVGERRKRALRRPRDEDDLGLLRLGDLA